MAAANSSSNGANGGENVIDSKDPVQKQPKACHQCRRRRSVATACKNRRKNKLCTLLYCHQCLLNRYGEKGEEVELSEVWSCPRCRDICNCSRCREKQGHLPTGHLSRKAKAAGYSSVSELLDAKGPENFGLVKNANDARTSGKKRGAPKKEIAARRKKGKEIVVVEGAVLDVQPLTAIPLQQSTMEELNYPSEDMMEDIDEAATDVYMEAANISWSVVPGNPISTSQHTADLFVDVKSDSEDNSPDADAPPSAQYDYHDQIFPETFDGVQGIEDEKHAAGKKMLTYHSIPNSSEKRKALEEEIARVSKRIDEEANKGKTVDLAALPKEVDELSANLARTNKSVAMMSDALKNISNDVRKQATASYADHQDLLHKVNLLQQSHDCCRETQLQMLSLIVKISNKVGVSVEEIKKGEEKLGDASCRVDANQERDDHDTHGPSGFKGSERVHDKSLGKLPES